jgi:lipopolysaccharide biosynthesis glycosyltransferase
MNQKPVVVYCSDGNDVDFMNASMFSVNKAMNGDVDFYVLSDFLGNEDVPLAKKIIDPLPILSDIGFFSDGWNRRWPYATLYRMAIPFIDDFKGLDRVLYLDTDVLARSPDMRYLFEADAGANEILAVKDSNGTSARVDKCIRSDLMLKAMVAVASKLWSARKVEDHVYVNAGVAVWCLDNIRRNGIDWYRQRLEWFWEAECRCKFDYLDQDFINSMMVTSAAFERRFNHFADMPDNIDKAVLKHYILSTKKDMLRDARALGFNPVLPAASDRPRAIVYASDGRDSDRLIMSAASARLALGDNVKFFILTELDKYPGFQGATLVNPMGALKSIGFFKDGWNRRWPFACLFRLAIPLLDEFAGYDRLLYLDTDTLVRSRAVDQLFTMQSGGFEAAGAQDIECRQMDIEKHIKFSLSPEARSKMKKALWDRRAKAANGYINSGVLVEFLDEIRNNGIDWYKQRMKWFWEAITRGKFSFPDQDFINVMMDVAPVLSVRFNRFAGDFGTNCIVQHFVGNTKANMKGTASKMGISI